MPHYVTRVESIASTLPELIPSLYEHWVELAMWKDKMPLAPNYQFYLQKERLGEILFVTVRADGGELVGYYIAFLAICHHYSTILRASHDIMRIKPEHRATGVGFLLFTRVEEELRKRGVSLWYTGSKFEGPTHEPMDKLVRKLGFIPTDLYYGKWLG